jgi:RHS repeat-associated protein
MSTTSQLSENSHRGFEGLKAALYLGSMAAKSNTASGLQLRLRQNGIGSRSSGKERDAETGLDYFGARYYSGAQGRFISADPLLNSGRPDIPQSWNRYSYTLNNPLKYIDPDGLWEWEANTCAKNDKACQNKRAEDQQWFRAAVNELDEALRIADPDSLEAGELRLIRQMIGTENDGGIVVSFDTRRLRKVNAAGGSKKGIVFFGDPRELFNDIAARNRQQPNWLDPITESAARVVHEFAHQLYTATRENILMIERSAYRFQSDINYVFNKSSLYGLWNPVWGKVDSLKYLERREQAIKDREKAINDNAVNSRDAYFKQ